MYIHTYVQECALSSSPGVFSSSWVYGGGRLLERDVMCFHSVRCSRRHRRPACVAGQRTRSCDSLINPITLYYIMHQNIIGCVLVVCFSAVSQGKPAFKIFYRPFVVNIFLVVLSFRLFKIPFQFFYMETNRGWATIQVQMAQKRSQICGSSVKTIGFQSHSKMIPNPNMLDIPLLTFWHRRWNWGRGTGAPCPL